MVQWLELTYPSPHAKGGLKAAGVGQNQRYHALELKCHFGVGIVIYRFFIGRACETETCK